MPNAIFYDDPQPLQEDFGTLRPRTKVTKRPSFLQKIKRSLSLDKTDSTKMEAQTISRLMAQSLNLTQRILHTSTLNIHEDKPPVPEQTAERSDVYYSEPAILIRRKSLRGRTAKEKFERSSETKRRKSISGLYSEGEEDEKIKHDKHNPSKISQKVLKYERLSFEGFEDMQSELNVKINDCHKCNTGNQTLSRKLSIKPRPGTVKSLVKKFEMKENGRTSILTELRTKSGVGCICEEVEGGDNTQDGKVLVEEVEKNGIGEEKRTDGEDFGLEFLFSDMEDSPRGSKDIDQKIKTDDRSSTDSTPSPNRPNRDSEEMVSEIKSEIKRRSGDTVEESDGDRGFLENGNRDSFYSDGDDGFNEHRVQLRKKESNDSGFLSYKRPNQVYSEDSHRLSELSNDSARMSVDSDNASSSVGFYDGPTEEHHLSRPIDDFSSSSEDETEKINLLPSHYFKPLYQIYSRDADAAAAREQISHYIIPDNNNEIENPQNPNRPHALDLIANKTRIFWKDVPAVQQSEYLTKLNETEKKKQEAKFEILISEASYVKSLQVLEKHYMKNLQYLAKSSDFFSEKDYKSLFGNISEVRKCSENFLNDLNKHWQNDILLTDIYGIITKHATNSFRTYISYSNQYLDMTLKYNELLNGKPKIKDLLELLCKHQTAKNLPLESFLALPIQRITRFPLLMNNVLQFTEKDSEEFRSGLSILNTLKQLAQECDNEIEKKRRTEELLLVSQQIGFLPEVKWIPIVISSRYLVLQTKVQQFMFRDKAMRKLGLQLFLFDDILLITKKSLDRPSNEEHWSVIDYCKRDLVQAEAMDKLYLLGIPELAETNAISLTLQSNHKGEKSEMVVSFQKIVDRERWIEALTPSSTDSLRKTLAAKPNAVQVRAVSNYKSTRPDELDLWIGDVVHIIGEPMEGWCRGEKLRNGKIGWFPQDCTVEITEEDVKKANMKLKKELQKNSEQYQQNLNRKHSLFESYA